MPRKSLSEEIDQRRQVEYFLNEGVLSVYAIARKVGVSETTVRKYRDLLKPQQSAFQAQMHEFERTVPKADETTLSPVTVLVPPTLPSASDPLRIDEAPVPVAKVIVAGEPVVFNGVQRTVERFLPGDRVELRALPNGHSVIVSVADVTPL